MKKIRFSSEILCLFFILTSTIFFMKIMTDVKDIIVMSLESIIPEKNISVIYQAYSYRTTTEINDLNEMNIIKDKDELNSFKELLNEEKIKEKWLNNKLKSYKDDFFENKTLVVLNIKNEKNVSVTRISQIYKKSEEGEITIKINRARSNNTKENNYSWLAIIEIEDNSKEFNLSIEEI